MFHVESPQACVYYIFDENGERAQEHGRNIHGFAIKQDADIKCAVLNAPPAPHPLKVWGYDPDAYYANEAAREYAIADAQRDRAEYERVAYHQDLI